MNENGERIRPRGGESPQKNPKKEDNGVFLTGIQIVVCVLVIGAGLLFRQFGATLYNQAEPFIKSAVNTDIKKEDVTDVFKNIGKSMPDAAEIFKTDSSVSSGSSSKTSSSNSASSATSSNSTSSGASSSQKSAASSAVTSSNSNSSSQASNSSKATASSKTTSSKITSSLAARQLSVSGSFEKPELNTSLLSTESKKPPETGCFSPFKLSQLPIKPVVGKMTSAYGYRTNPVSGKYSFHSGMDIAAETGTPIRAAFAGTVENVGKDETYGNFIVLNHGNNIRTFYGHCSEIVSKQGEKIKGGDTIAKVGSTGESTGPHLHFEVRLSSTKYNPQWVV